VKVHLQKGRKHQRAKDKGGNKKRERQQMKPQGQRSEEEVLHGAGGETPAAACGGPFVGVAGCFLKEQESAENPCWSQGKGWEGRSSRKRPVYMTISSHPASTAQVEGDGRRVGGEGVKLSLRKG